jgi:putative lysine transport system permease protein
VLFLVDFVVLDFVSRHELVEKPNSDTSTYDIIIYFIREYDVNFIDGIKTTLKLALLGTVIGLLLAFLLVSLRILESNPRDNDLIKLFKKIGNSFANIYVTIIRGTPMIVQAFIFYYLVLGIVRPTMELNEYRDFIENVWTPFRAGLFTVSINTTAYLTEVLRGGISSIDKGQKEAGEALGLTRFQTMIHIIFPQAIKNSLPSIGNEFIINIKDTSVLTLIGVLDLFSVAKNDILGKFSANSLEAYLIVAVYYLVLTYLTSKLLQYFEKKMNMPVKGITSSN